MAPAGDMRQQRPASKEGQAVDLLGPEFGALNVDSGGGLRCTASSGAAKGAGLPDLDMLAQWWKRQRPRANKDQRSSGAGQTAAPRHSHFTASATAQHHDAVDAAVESTPAHVPTLVEAVAATVLFDFGVDFGGADSEAPQRQRRSRGHRKRSTCDTVAAGDTQSHTGTGGAPCWQPVRMGVSAARNLVGEKTLQECLIGGGGGSAGSGNAGVQSLLAQVSAAEALPPSDRRRRRLRRLQRAVLRQREQVAGVRLAGALLQQLESWLLAAQQEVLEGSAQCQQARSWLREAFWLMGW